MTLAVIYLLLLVAVVQGQNQTAKLVCDVCDCKDEKIDCSSRNLEDDLSQYEWPANQTFKLVTFENNRITRVKQFPEVSVHTLVLANNAIQKIDLKAFSNLADLTVLDLSNNQLTHNNFTHEALEGDFEPGLIQPLESLKVLNLSGNKFHTLDSDTFEHVIQLNTLILSNNPFDLFDLEAIRAIGQFSNLEELDLSRCRLSKLDERIFNPIKNNLKRLNLSWNNFKELPHALIPQLALETLYLDGNPIARLDSNHSFPNMTSLKELHMSNMTELRVIKDGALGYLSGLEVLYIENCTNLENIESYSFAHQPEVGGRTWLMLKKLFLSNNKLRYFPTELVARWDKLKEMHVMNNQWSCDCDNQHFIDYILPEYGTALMGNETDLLLCSSPSEYENQTLVSLASKRPLRCLSKADRDAAVIVGALIGVLLAIPITLALFVLWARGFFFCGRQSPASFSRAFYKRTNRYEEDF